MLVAIFEREELLEHRECREVRLPTGAPGAVWRGLAYPLREPGAIQIDGMAYPPALCEPLPAADRLPPSAGVSWALIDGGDESYVVFEGSIIEAETTVRRLKDAGIEIRRYGRYLGDPVDGCPADWFVRFVRPSLGDIRDLLGELLGKQPSVLVKDQSDALVMRCRLLARELEEARADKLSLQGALSDLTVKLAEVEGRSRSEIEQLLEAFDDSRRERELAQMSAAALPPVAADRAPRPAKPSGKLKEEVASVVKALLPRIELVRDTIAFVTTEMQTRTHLYRALAELNSAPDGMPPSWKKLQGLQRWWERHVSTGQDDAGRIYARLDPSSNRWLILVSHKGDQSRDLVWLDRNC